jgi:hypothetical protein
MQNLSFTSSLKMLEEANNVMKQYLNKADYDAVVLSFAKKKSCYFH